MARIDGSMWSTNDLTVTFDTNPFHTNRTPKEDTKMNKRYAEARAEIRDRIVKALEDVEGIRVLTTDDDVSGPMGGKSDRVLGFTDNGEDGGLVAFAVNVYADDKIEDKADEVVEALKVEREKREAIFGSEN